MVMQAGRDVTLEPIKTTQSRDAGAGANGGVLISAGRLRSNYEDHSRTSQAIRISITMTPYIFISIISKVDSTDWQFGEQILKTLEQADSRLLPEKVGNFEPLRATTKSVDDCRAYWANFYNSSTPGLEKNSDDFIWKRTKSIKSSGQMLHKRRSLNGSVKAARLVFRSAADRKVAWPELFKNLCRILDPKYGTLHLVTDIEDVDGAFGEEADASYATNDFLNGVPPFRLDEQGPANICWGNYFGPEFSDELSNNGNIESVFQCESIQQGNFAFVTDNIFDVSDNFEYFSNQREKLKGAFRKGFFRINHEPKPYE